jgi:hypothetical protein
LEHGKDEKLFSFGPGHNGYGFGLTIDRGKDGEQHVATIDYGDTFDLIFIETFTDYMEFIRQFGHLGAVAEVAETNFHVRDAHEFALDMESGILRDQVRERQIRMAAVKPRLKRSRSSSTERADAKE